jgi:hypothetical protein
MWMTPTGNHVMPMQSDWQHSTTPHLGRASSALLLPLRLSSPSTGRLMSCLQHHYTESLGSLRTLAACTIVQSDESDDRAHAMDHLPEGTAAELPSPGRTYVRWSASRLPERACWSGSYSILSHGI